MPRPSRINEQREELLPVVARAFSELGYRRATTAELAKRCGVRENILFRLWPDKKQMFIATIEYVYQLSEQTWSKHVGKSAPAARLKDLLDYEAEHIGEFGHHRIIFVGLSEAHDPEIRAALARMYGRFHTFIREHLQARKRAPGEGARGPDAEVAAWALIGLGTLATISRELRLVSPALRKRLLKEVGGFLIDG